MRRRELITALGGAVLAWPLAAHAQQRAMPVVGLLSPGSREADLRRLNGIRQGLKEGGYIDGRNVTIEYRGASGQIDRLPGLAAELVRREVVVIIAVAATATSAAKSATTTIPIVFDVGVDPVAEGFRHEPQPSGRQFDRRASSVRGARGKGKSCYRPEQFDEFIGHEAGFEQLQSCLRDMLFGLTVEASAIGPVNPRLPKARQSTANAAAWSSVF
jgi:ABC transporter substrate binding protein